MVERSVGFDGSRGDQISLQVFDFTGAVPGGAASVELAGNPLLARLSALPGGWFAGAATT